MDFLKRYRKMISLRGLTDHTMKSYTTYIKVYLDYIENHLHNSLPENLTLTFPMFQHRKIQYNFRR